MLDAGAPSRGRIRRYQFAQGRGEGVFSASR